MIEDVLATSYQRDSEVLLREARRLLEEDVPHLAVRRAQEAIELALKAALRTVGINPPRIHNVGPDLLNARGRFPLWFQEQADTFADYSDEAEEDRLPSLYGNQRADVPPAELYSADYASRAIEQAAEVVAAVRRLFDEAKQTHEKAEEPEE